MPKLKTYSEFVNEALIDAVKNPIKWKKIKNNAKKYQKARVAQALNDVDYAKRKEKGSDTLSKKQQEVLTQANKAKNSALADTASNIGQRMADLATTDGLKQVVKLAKTKSSLAANKIVLKAADGEEAKRLKIKQTKLTGKATDAQKALADYESDGNDKPTEDKEKAKIATTEKPATKETPKAEETPKTKLSAADKKKADKIQKLGNKIGDAMKAIKKAKTERVLAQKEENELDKEKEAAKGTNTEAGLAKQVAAADKAGKDIEKAITDLQQNIKDLQQQQKKLNESAESFEYVAESVSEKFARLRKTI